MGTTADGGRSHTREGAKADPAAALPALGGKPSGALEKKPSDVVPKDLTPGQ